MLSSLLWAYRPQKARLEHAMWATVYDLCVGQHSDNSPPCVAYRAPRLRGSGFVLGCNWRLSSKQQDQINMTRTLGEPCWQLPLKILELVIEKISEEETSGNPDSCPLCVLFTGNSKGPPPETGGKVAETFEKQN